jgi:hypothetical protein
VKVEVVSAPAWVGSAAGSRGVVAIGMGFAMVWVGSPVEILLMDSEP